MADQETYDALYKNEIPGCKQRSECDADTHVNGGIAAVTVICAESTSHSNEAAITPSECLQTCASSLMSVGETCNSDIQSPANAADTVLVQSSKCPFTDGSTSSPAGHPVASYSASAGQDCPPGSAHLKTEEIVSVDSSSSCSPGSNTSSIATSDVQNQAFHSHTDGQSPNSVSDSVDTETRTNLVDTEDFLPRVTCSENGSADQAKSAAVVSTPEAQSVKCSVLQSSLHTTRQVKCRKTGHRRITANGANLSLGQLINAVSESCLSDSLDSTYIPASSLSSRSGAAEHRVMTTPIKAVDASDSSVIKEKLSRQFDESVCYTASPVNGPTAESQGSPQVVDGVRRPPKARKSCHSNDSRTSDLPQEPLSPSMSAFGSVCLADLVDAQSLDKLDKLDVRTFDDMLLSKIRERMRPSNGYKMVLHNSEQSPMRPAVSTLSDGATATISDNKAQGPDSGAPLIPSAAKTANQNCDSPTRSVCLKSSAGTDVIEQHEKLGSSGSSAVRNNVSEQSVRKRVWRCRKSSWSPGKAQHSAGSKLNCEVKHSGEKPSGCDATVETQSTRRSPRCAKRGPSWLHLDEVGKCD